ncbi:MAG: sialidase, partial [Candidatus Aminicenantales bacterium]
RPAYRFLPVSGPMSQSDDPTAGKNPPYGASINYYLKSAPDGEVSLQILDAQGKTIRKLKGTKSSGINRIWWDLRYEQTKEIRLRTSPAYAPEIRLGPKGWRPLPEGERMSILASPGTYTVKLIAGKQEFTQPLLVKKDPNSKGSEADIQAQMEILSGLRQNLEEAADMVKTIEVVRAQLYDLTALLKDEKDKEICSTANELDKKLVGIEDNLIQRKLTGQGQDDCRWPSKLVSKITYLASDIASSDFPPTAQEKEVYALLKEKVKKNKQQLEEVLSRDLAVFNNLLKKKNIQNIIVRVP